MKVQIVSVIALMVTACQPSEPTMNLDASIGRPEIADDISPDDAAEWTLACSNGQGLVVTFDHPRQMATVRRSDGQAFDLMRTTTGSGYLYSATQTELHGEGKRAKWASPRVSDTTCTVTEIKLLKHP